VDVVLSDRELPEGGWREMLSDLQALADPPALVVKARLADDSLWAEVLNMGGYDVLAEPLDNDEVRRVMSAAARHFVNERQRRAPAVSKPLALRAAS
jgi:DNA-binding response OmpR family regulator